MGLTLNGQKRSTSERSECRVLSPMRRSAFRWRCMVSDERSKKYSSKSYFLYSNVDTLPNISKLHKVFLQYKYNRFRVNSSYQLIRSRFRHFRRLAAVTFTELLVSSYQQQVWFVLFSERLFKWRNSSFSNFNTSQPLLP